MEKNYPEITRSISANLKILRKDITDTMSGFSAMAQAATRDGAIDKKTKELIALALGVAARCDGCIGFHVEALVKLGATREEDRRNARHGDLYGWWSIPYVCRRCNCGL